MLYMAPEVINGNYNEKCDVWSCGILMHLMLTKNFPFNDPTKEGVERQIIMMKENDYLSKALSLIEISDGSKKLLKKMLEYDAMKRVSMENALHDEWLQQYNLTKSLDDKIVKRTLVNLLQLKFERKLQEFVWMFFVNNFNSNSVNLKDNVLHVFQSVDLNGDGILSKEELIQAYSRFSAGNIKKAEKYVEKVFHDLDTNKNGSIDYSEFVIGALSKENFLTKKKLKMGFQMLDKVFHFKKLSK